MTPPPMTASRSLWIAARARNAARRGWHVALAGSMATVLMVTALVVVPHLTAHTARAQLMQLQRDPLAWLIANTSSAPWPAMVLAALTVGMAVGFGAVLAREMRHPTIGDAAELERLTRSAVYVHSRDTPSTLVERSRWRERPGVPRIIDRTSDTYVLLHLALSGVGDLVSDVDVVADDALIGAAVALGTAAAAAGESRAVALVEGAGRRPPLADVLQVQARLGRSRRAPREELTLEEVAYAVTLDRDARIDVLFAGDGDAYLRELEARYDLRIHLLETPSGRSGVAPVPAPTPSASQDLVVCVRRGATSMAWLARVVRDANRRHQRVRAVVLWNRERPRA
ncbi:MAG: hypothetical protein IT353_19040 [Gemmatimonadaceae bacterium]|nr:hypothetical protein [Gemmatimonadaceae bacterium]